MKWIIAAAFAAISFFATGNLYAQEMLRATVPFDFHVGKTAMPSGTYQIASCSVASNVLIVRNCAKPIAVMQLTFDSGAQPSGNSILIFNRYGEEYFLSEVRGLPIGSLALPVSSLERELQGTVRTFETITVPQTAEPQEPE